MSHTHNDPVLVISMDPGKKISFVAILITGETLTVVAWGKVSVALADIGLHPASVLTTTWEAVSIGHQASCFLELIKFYSCKTRFVWEQQRGYLNIVLGKPFVNFAQSSGLAVECVSPSEKFYSLRVSKNKQEGINYVYSLVQEGCKHHQQNHHNRDYCILHPELLWRNSTGQADQCLPQGPQYASVQGC